MGDLSRQAAIDELIAMREHIGARMSVVGGTAYEMAIEALREPERKKGKWIHGKEIAREYIGGGLAHIEYEDCHCSECGYTVKRIRWNVDGELVDRYCSFCGADMRYSERME